MQLIDFDRLRSQEDIQVVVCALIGIIIRNSVILATQIYEFSREGRAPSDAVVEATCQRGRPILLTAAAASLGMIPIARQVFWGPMAYAMIGGIIAGTVLTLIFLPALYVAAYRIGSLGKPKISILNGDVHQDGAL